MTSRSCPTCDTPVPEDAGFCPSCGEATPTQISAETVPTGERFIDSDELEYRHRLARALGDDYELRDLIGRGGFGSVYAAWDKRLERDVAVKALRHDLFPAPAILQRFEREAKAVAKLRHPNILPIYTIGEGQGIAYMVMPLVEGESLQAHTDREGRLPVDEAVRITAEAASALEAAHKLGFVHRDVKPANIMLDGDERRVLLMDFGIAKSVMADEAGITGTGVIIGSPAYMSPEQARGEKDIDGRSDLYSLGAVSYELLSGQRPFPVDSLHELVYKHVTAEAADLGELVPTVPKNVRQAVMRCLAKDRDHRWQTAADFRRSISATKSDTVTVDEYVHVEDESWLVRRGPYLLLLAFLLYFIRFIQDMFGSGPNPELHAGVLEALALVMTGLIVLAIVAVLDGAGRAGIHLLQGRPWRHVRLFLLGQPNWWQTWYPRSLRVPDSVWDRLPFSMKVLRTLVWLELILLFFEPAGWTLVIFVIPTFQSWSASIGRELPLLIRVFVFVTYWGLYALPVIAAVLWWQFRYWHTKHAISVLVLFVSLFNLRGSYWQGSPARVILRD